MYTFEWVGRSTIQSAAMSASQFRHPDFWRIIGTAASHTKNNPPLVLSKQHGSISWLHHNPSTNHSDIFPILPNKTFPNPPPSRTKMPPNPNLLLTPVCFFVSIIIPKCPPPHVQKSPAFPASQAPESAPGRSFDFDLKVDGMIWCDFCPPEARVGYSKVTFINTIDVRALQKHCNIKVTLLGEWMSTNLVTRELPPFLSNTTKRNRTSGICAVGVPVTERRSWDSSFSPSRLATSWKSSTWWTGLAKPWKDVCIRRKGPGQLCSCLGL